MKCPDPLCRADTRILLTTSYDGYTRRRHECFNLHRFTTYESVEVTSGQLLFVKQKLQERGFTQAAVAEILGLSTKSKYIYDLKPDDKANEQTDRQADSSVAQG